MSIPFSDKRQRLYLRNATRGDIPGTIALSHWVAVLWSVGPRPVHRELARTLIH